MSKKIFLVLILSFQIIKSQQIYFPVYHYESENGLIHLNVLSIQQSNDNVLYFITQGGVYEYTGKEFRKNQVYSQLKNIRNLLFTDSTTLLIHRDNGLYKIINKKHIQPLFEKNPFKKPCDKILLNDIFFINYTDQISVESYDLKNNRYYNDSILLKDNSNQAFCFLKIKNQILIGRRKGLYIFDNGKQKLITHFSGTPIYSLFYDESKHRLYLGSKDRIIIADDSLFKIQHQISIKNLLPSQSGQFIFSFEKNISKLIVDKFDRIWFSVQPDDNLYLYENNTIYDALSTLNILPTLLNDLFLDKFNNIWIATFNDGVYQIASTHWKSFKINFNQKNFNVRNIETSDKYVYFFYK
ncbi:MAG: hypothetical protein KatS3mg027_2054 [Bacteroidia bacterium]|nr:MAG: hypothetical protein KatS3mg027_2054 [Bacteroidia bacterium]